MRPGPLSPLLGLDHLLAIRRDQLAFYTRMQRDHGDMVRLRLGPFRSWLVFHPDQVEEVLARKPEAFIRFRRLTDVLRQWNGESLLIAEGAAWQARRRKVLPAFQTRRLPGHGATILDETEALIGRLRAGADAGGRVTLDLDATMARLTLNVAVRTLFGAEAPGNGNEIGAALDVLSETAFAESTAPLVLPDWLPLPGKRAKARAIATLRALVAGLVARRMAQAPASDDLLSMLIDQHGDDVAAIRDDSMSLLIAGHETSGAALTWLFACLAGHPAWTQSLRDELARVLQGRPPQPQDLRDLPLLRATVDEALRLYPPAYSLFLRQAVQPVTIGGQRLARGDLVQILPFQTQRDPRFFARPETFDPARFLAPPTWPPFAVIPFGAGPRVCIGQNFALMEITLIAARLLQALRPEPLDRMPDPRPRFSLRPAGPVLLTCHLV